MAPATELAEGPPNEIGQMNMNAAVEGLGSRLKSVELPDVKKPSREEAEAAVRTLIAWAGDNPNREGLIDTPGRVTRAYEEFFEGYNADPI